MTPNDALGLFLKPVRDWFTATLGSPTEAQCLAWPAITAGQNALLLAPTGSGKTLAAFLACLDRLWRQPKSKGVKILYLSPLKALNNDIDRNLRLPLAGVTEAARTAGTELRTLTSAVRTGDTPARQRQEHLRNPPEIFITTPESLHLLLTSRGQDILESVETVIIDEIHALCGVKRGVFLSLLLERLECAIQKARPSAPPLQRIGLSATQRPLDAIARFLGGGTLDSNGVWTSRPVSILDAGRRKSLDLSVVHPVEAFGPLPEKSVWPSIYRLLRSCTESHISTLIFSNDRRASERITAGINGDEEPILAHAHHGSVSLEKRKETEEALKEGRLRAVVATASLEMGIDMGAVDLVCQVESPGSVARGLQRVGRAGHSVGQTSKGILIPKTARDLTEMAALCQAMLAGDVEPTRIPTCCLDILAQQVVAMVAMRDWNVTDLYQTVRQACPYRDLTPGAFDAVLEMLSGRFRLTRPLADTSLPATAEVTGRAPRPTALEALHARIGWDRVNNRLEALPGTKHLALTGGGAIPDTGNLPAFTAEGLRVGELDEEFVYERRVGDAFLLGTSVWRIESIEPDRVRVIPAPGALAVMPFWRGEGPGRTLELGRSLGQLTRAIIERLDAPDRIDWLKATCALDAACARDLFRHISRQILIAGCVPDDRTILVEASRDPLGDWQLLILTPLGSRFHLGLRLALEGVLTQKLGYRPQCLHHDDGVLVRLSDSAEPPMNLLDWLDPERLEDQILTELADSPLFAIRFRQNASRALLLPRALPGKRAPLWLQRLRGKDLLQVARRHPDFPIIAETYRECLQDHLEINALADLLRAVRKGEATVVTRRAETPCPFAADVLFSFTAAFMYQLDAVEPESKVWQHLDRQLLDEVLPGSAPVSAIDPRAVAQVERRLRRQGMSPRTAPEMLDFLGKVGDLLEVELEGGMAGMLEHLRNQGTAGRIRLGEQWAWHAMEHAGDYETALGTANASSATRHDASARILSRYLDTRALVSLNDILARYPFDRDWTARRLEEWSAEGRVVPVLGRTTQETIEYSAPANWDQVRQGSLGILRRDVVSVPPQQYAAFLATWQGAHPSRLSAAPDGIGHILDRLALHAAPLEAWERGILPARLAGFSMRQLDAWCLEGHGCWSGGPDAVTFLSRGLLCEWNAPPAEPDPEATDVLEHLRQCGATFIEDLALRLQKPPSTMRTVLWSLVEAGLVSNDRLDACRAGAPKATQAPADPMPAHKRARMALREGFASPVRQRGEGRWFHLPFGAVGAEQQALTAAMVLLRRYGIINRDLANLCPAMPPWRILMEVLNRLELSGDIRRGYFVEGLAGAQFALPEALEGLRDAPLANSRAEPLIALHALDPANLYGAGAPLDLPLLDGGKRSFPRRAGNWIVQRAGLPVLLAEKDGRKLTTLPTTSPTDLADALKALTKPLLAQGNGRWTVETIDEASASGKARPVLESAGFVSDYLSMVLYGDPPK